MHTHSFKHQSASNIFQSLNNSFEIVHHGYTALKLYWYHNDAVKCPIIYDCMGIRDGYTIESSNDCAYVYIKVCLL